MSAPLALDRAHPPTRTERAAAMSAASNKHLVKELANSAIFKDYERAFGETTGLPLTLRPVEDWQVANHGKRNENPFCAMMSECNRTCAACLNAQHKVGDPAAEEPCTVVCYAGLCESAVPLRAGGNLLGFLQTGEVMLHNPTRRGFGRVQRLLAEWDADWDSERVREAWFSTKVLSRKQYSSALRLLSIFAQHLSLVANQMLLQSKQAEPPSVTTARQYILDHRGENLSLATVARAVHMSSFYFCKTFKKATGMNYTEFLARARIEKAKELLHNPNARVSEVALASGFQSVTHFNRIFRRHAGKSPTEYRASLPKVA